MKAPPEHVEPIKADRLREIIERRRYEPPPDAELSVLAAVLTGIQSCNLPGDWGQGGDFYVHVDATTKGSHAYIEGIEGIKGTPARFGNKGPPPQPRLTFDADKRLIGHPRRKQRVWRDFAPDIAAQLQQMMKKANPDGPGFGDRDGPLAELVADMLQLVFSDREITASAVGQCAARRRKTSARR